jgi:hypothetical protein
MIFPAVSSREQQTPKEVDNDPGGNGNGRTLKPLTGRKTIRVKSAASRPNIAQIPDRTDSRKTFLCSLDRNVRSQVLFSGYLRARFLELDLESLGFDRNLDSFFSDCTDEDYYRFFQPLSPRHPLPYQKSFPLKSTSTANVSSCLTYIDVGLFALENLTEGENSVRAGFKICASWQPAQQEIRKAKYLNPNVRIFICCIPDHLCSHFTLVLFVDGQPRP